MGKDDKIDSLGDARDDEVLRSILERGAGLVLHQAFDAFDAMNGDVSDAWLANVADRARAILDEHSSDSVVELVSLAEHMLQHQLRIDPWDYPKVYGPGGESVARRLRRRQSFFELEAVEDAPNLTWPEVYAAIALAYVGRGLQSGEIIESMTAMEAVCTAETLRDQADAVEVETSQRIKASKTRAAHTRAEKLFGPWKEKLLALWDCGSYKTRAACARDFLDREPGVIRSLPGKNNQRTLVSWITNHINHGGGRDPEEPPRDP